jgi:A/G-specific adenine glycosylase
MPKGLEKKSVELSAFHATVLAAGEIYFRDLPWRHTHDPYRIWISEVMLQQTQVKRVDGRWQRWLERFPDISALAGATSAEVLEEWQGMGYNRRALSLLEAARIIMKTSKELPCDSAELITLPGIGAATAAGIRAFAFDLPSVYLETNVRTVFLHELFPDELDVADSRIIPLIEASCPKDADNPLDDPRSWYYALLDYGAHLKKVMPNPSRRSRSHVRQSAFEGSHRQKRAELLRILLKHTSGLTLKVLVYEMSELEQRAGRGPLFEPEILDLLNELTAEGFCRYNNGIWTI